MSPWDGLDRAPLRIGLACVGCVDAVGLAFQIRDVAPGLLTHPDAPRLLLSLYDHTAVLVVLVVLALGGFVLFARGRAMVVGGLTSVVSLAILSEAHAAFVGGPARNFYIVGAATLGWVFGVGYARLRAGRLTQQARGEDRFAEFSALGFIAATYVNAAMSKLLLGGASWADANHLRSIIVAQHSISDATWRASYAHAVANHGGLSLGLIWLALVVQFGAISMLGPVRLRQIAALGVLGFHINNLLLTDIFDGEAMVIVALFAFSWPRLVRRVLKRPEVTFDDSERKPDPRRVKIALVAAASCILVLSLVGALPGIRAYTSHHHSRNVQRPDPPVSPEVTALLRGLAVGDQLAGLTVVSMTGQHDGEMHIKFGRGDARLVLTIARTGYMPHSPPRSSGGYDIFYGYAEPGVPQVSQDELNAAIEAMATRLAAP